MNSCLLKTKELEKEFDDYVIVDGKTIRVKLFGLTEPYNEKLFLSRIKLYGGKAGDI